MGLLALSENRAKAKKVPQGRLALSGNFEDDKGEFGVSMGIR